MASIVSIFNVVCFTDGFIEQQFSVNFWIMWCNFDKLPYNIDGQTAQFLVMRFFWCGEHTLENAE